MSDQLLDQLENKIQKLKSTQRIAPLLPNHPDATYRYTSDIIVIEIPYDLDTLRWFRGNIEAIGFKQVDMGNLASKEGVVVMEESFKDVVMFSMGDIELNIWLNAEHPLATIKKEWIARSDSYPHPGYYRVYSIKDEVNA